MAARTGSRLPPGFDGFPRRGRCPHRPAWFRVQGSPSTAPSPVHAVGADYISAQDRVHRPSPVYIAPGSGRAMRAPTGCAFGDGAFVVDTGRADVGIGPYGVRSSMVHPTHRCARADIKSAPTDPPPGFLVGAACMAARTGSRLPPGFDGFPRRGRCPHRPAWFRVQGSPSTAPSPVHAVGADYISAQDRVHRPSPVYIAPGSGRAMRAPTGCAFGDGAFVVDTGRADVGIGPYGVRSSMVHPTHRCARADIKSAPTDPPPGFLVGAACMAARTGSRLPPEFDGFPRRGARSAGGCL